MHHPNCSHKMMLITLSLPLFLTACASLNSDFECKTKAGIPCKSIDEVNTLIDKYEDSKNTTPSSREQILRVWVPSDENSDCLSRGAHLVDAIMKEYR
jgi:hypothetical protein